MSKQVLPICWHKQPTTCKSFLPLSHMYIHVHIEENKNHNILLSFLLNGRGCFLFTWASPGITAPSPQPINMSNIATNITKKILYLCTSIVENQKIMLIHLAFLYLFPSHMIYLNLKMIQTSNMKCSLVGILSFKPSTAALNESLKEHFFFCFLIKAKTS